MKHPALKRQARVDCGPDGPAEDPWVRISDCIKSLFSPIMSENHSHTPLQPQVSLAEDGHQGHPEGTPTKLDTSNGAPKVYKSAENSIVKKGPPVAPKPAWFRQSLKGLRHRGPDPKQLPTASSTKPTPAPRELLGPHARASSSIQQRISSFETFGSSQLPDRGAQRLSLQPPSSSAEAAKPPEKQEGWVPGLLGRGAPSTVEQPHPQQEQLPGPHAATEASDPGAPGTPPPGRLPSEKALTPDPLLRLLSAQTAEPPGTVVKMPSQRARSFPLTRTQSCDAQLLDDRTCKLYSISSHVSSAVMKSLLCLPSSLSCGQTPGGPEEGAPAGSWPSQDLAAGPADTGFSLK